MTKVAFFKKSFLYSAILVFLTMPALLPRAYAMGNFGGQKQVGEQQGKKEIKAGQIRALIYHHFGREDTYPSTSVSVEQFEKHLAYLKKNDYTVLTLGQALDRLYGKAALAEKTAVLTIDDGYRSVWENARPLLDKYGFAATLFISTGNVGGSNYLTWEEIQKLENQGFEIGNHSHSHTYFLNKPKDQIAEAFEKDLKKADEQFRKHLGRVPDLYAYPFGEYTPEMMEVLKAHGYRAAAAQRSGVIHGCSSRYALPRFPMNYSYGDMEGFSNKMGMNALAVLEAQPESPLLAKNSPPRLTLRIDEKNINPDGLQCFVNGRGACDMKKKWRNGGLILTVRATERLTDRRNLYTITAPSTDGSRWHWYSHLWVIPQPPSPAN
mgnify:FL=1